MLSREEFTRRAAMLDVPFSPSWVASTLTIVGAAIGLGLFAFRDLDYRLELWLWVDLYGDMSRFLRASAGVILALTVLGVARLTRRPRPAMVIPAESERVEAAALARATSTPGGQLVLLGDQALLWNPARTRLPDVRRPRPHLGRVGRAHRSDERGRGPGRAVPRTLRRLQRPAGRVSGLEGLAARLHRLRPDVCDPRGGRARLPAALLDRRQRPPRHAHDGGASRAARREDAGGDTAEGRSTAAVAGRRVRRVACRAGRSRAGVCGEPLRPSLHVVVPGCRRHASRHGRSVRDAVVAAGPPHAGGRHGPPPPRRAARHCRRDDRLAAGVGAPAWLHVVRPGDGPAGTQRAA